MTPEGPAAPGAHPEDGAGGSESAALILARWTSLSIEEVVLLYDGLGAATINSKAALLLTDDLVWIDDLRVRQIMALCRAAQDAGFLIEYCLAIVRVERTRGRAADQLGTILKRITKPGTAEAILDADAGFSSTDLFDVLRDITRAVGYVEEEDGTIRGTALLIRSDVVITSAHVAFEPKVRAGRVDTAPPLRPIKRISFPKANIRPQEAALDKVRPLVAFSPALMTSVTDLDPQIDTASLARLDYALLKLDHPIDRTEPINHKGEDVAIDGRHTYLIAYPGTTGSKFDTNKLIRDEAVGGRVIHTINSVGGMSGGCLVNSRGVPVGLHEGSFFGAAAQLENRAILLKAIARDLEAKPGKPLSALSPPTGLVMYDAALVTRLGRRCAQLLADPASQADLEQLVAAVTRDVAPNERWTAHPWFADRARADIEKWFADAANSPDTKARIAFINGPHGSGKTFMIDVLKRILTDTGSRVLRVAWSEGDSTIAALGRQLEAPLDQSDTRTSDGHARYEKVPELVEALERYGRQPDDTGPRSRPLFVAIDAGDGTGSVTEQDVWIDLVVALSQQSWARVVLCGLPLELIQRVEDFVASDIATRRFQIEHIRSRDIASFLERFGMPAGSTVSPQEAAATFDTPGQPHKTRPDLTTAMAALCAIGWHRGLLAVGAGGQP